MLPLRSSSWVCARRHSIPRPEDASSVPLSRQLEKYLDRDKVILWRARSLAGQLVCQIGRLLPRLRPPARCLSALRRAFDGVVPNPDLPRVLVRDRVHASAHHRMSALRRAVVFRWIFRHIRGHLSMPCLSHGPTAIPSRSQLRGLRRLHAAGHPRAQI